MVGQTVSGYSVLPDTPAHRPSQLSPVSVMTDIFIRPCPALVCFLGPGVAPLTNWSWSLPWKSKNTSADPTASTAWHNSSLVCMVGITYAYIDMAFGFMGTFWIKILFFNLHLLLSWMFEHDCLDTCCFGVLYFCICTCSAQLSMFHMERCSRNTLIIIIIINYNLAYFVASTKQHPILKIILPALLSVMHE